MSQVLPDATSDPAPMRRCPSCGRPNDGSQPTCWGCGTPLDQPAEPLPKLLLGQYNVVDLLGRGGMSTVYRARHHLTEQEVAIKVLLPELSTYADIKARFLQEARTLAKLEHPNVVALHNFVEEDGRLYLVMQFAEGETFESIIYRHGRLSSRMAARVIIEVLHALEYAHRLGVIHRDIKPSNVLVRSLEGAGTVPGSVKVTDFGIAKITQGELRMTQTGQTMGTVSYMSPEQVRGESADGRSDLYSLGVTLYEAVAGRLPFDGASHFDVMTKHVNEAPVAPSEQGVEIIPALEAVILKAMAKRASERYQDAAEMRAVLEAVLSSNAAAVSLPAPRPAPKSRRFLALGGGAALVVGGAIVLTTLWARTTPGGDGAADASRVAAVDAAVPPPAAPKEHVAVKALAWRADQKFGQPPWLRVLIQEGVAAGADGEITADTIHERFKTLRESYAEFLKKDGVTRPPRNRPITIAVVTSAVLENTAYFSAAGQDSHYVGDVATLFVKSELFGVARAVAFHLCPPKLARPRCLDIADRFEAAVEPPGEKPAAPAADAEAGSKGKGKGPSLTPRRRR